MEIFKKFMNKDNVFCFFALSEVFTLKLLKIYLVFVIENNFVCFSKTLGFKNVDYKTLKAFVSRSTITVHSEVEVFEAIVKWIEHNKNSRKHLMFDLLKMVRLPLLTSQIIQKFIRSNKFCQSCQKCCVYIDSVLADKRNSSF